MGPSCRGSPASMVKDVCCGERRRVRRGRTQRLYAVHAAPHRSQGEGDERLWLRRLRRLVDGHEAKVAGRDAQGGEHRRVPARAADDVRRSHCVGRGRGKEIPLHKRQGLEVVTQGGNRPPGPRHNAQQARPLPLPDRCGALGKAAQQLARQHVHRALLGRGQQAAAAAAEGLHVVGGAEGR